MRATTADVLRRLSALDLPAEAIREVMSIIADVQGADEENARLIEDRRRRDRERKREKATQHQGATLVVSAEIPSPDKGISAESPQTFQGNDCGIPQKEPSRTYARVLCSEEVSIYPPIEPTVLSPIIEKPKRAKPRRQIADDAQPTERDRAYADQGGLNSDDFRLEWRKFRNHHRAKGSLMADWEAAWRTWIDGRSRFANARAGPGGHVNGKPQTNLRMDVILESIEDERNGIIYDQSLF